MSAKEDFLARWSRRKREVADADKAVEPPAPPAAPDAAGAAALPRVDAADGKQTQPDEFDPASLPPIDSISALSDIRDFLRAGVPAELTRAALRRAWSADPAIRDFIGLAENAWDFTDPTAMPGFGPLEATDDVRAMVERIMSRPADPVELSQTVAPDAISQSDSAGDFQTVAPKPAQQDDDTIAVATHEQSAGEPKLGASEAPAVETEQADVAAQHADAKRVEQKPVLRRTHGGALPH